MKNVVITPQILEENGFARYIPENEALQKLDEDEGWVSYERWVDHEERDNTGKFMGVPHNQPYHFLITFNQTNIQERNWNLHVDNSHRETVASCALEYTYQFNDFAKVIDCKIILE